MANTDNPTPTPSPRQESTFDTAGPEVFSEAVLNASGNVAKLTSAILNSGMAIKSYVEGTLKASQNS